MKYDEIRRIWMSKQTLIKRYEVALAYRYVNSNNQIFMSFNTGLSKY